VIIEAGDPSKGDGGPNGVGTVKDVAIRADRADGFVLKNVKVRHAKEHGIYVLEADGYMLTHFKAYYNGLYGTLTFVEDHGVQQHCDAVGHGDSGVYPGAAVETGQQRPAGTEFRYNQEIRFCDLHHNMAGYSGTNGNAVKVHHNNIYDNALGLQTDVVTGAGHPGYPGDSMLVEKNIFYSNNFNVYQEDSSVVPAFPFPVPPTVVYGGAGAHDPSALIHETIELRARLECLREVAQVREQAMQLLLAEKARVAELEAQLKAQAAIAEARQAAHEAEAKVAALTVKHEAAEELHQAAGELLGARVEMIEALHKERAELLGGVVEMQCELMAHQHEAQVKQLQARIEELTADGAQAALPVAFRSAFAPTTAAAWKARQPAPTAACGPAGYGSTACQVGTCGEAVCDSGACAAACRRAGAAVGACGKSCKCGAACGCGTDCTCPALAPAPSDAASADKSAQATPATPLELVGFQRSVYVAEDGVEFERIGIAFEPRVCGTFAAFAGCGRCCAATDACAGDDCACEAGEACVCRACACDACACPSCPGTAATACSGGTCSAEVCTGETCVGGACACDEPCPCDVTEALRARVEALEQRLAGLEATHATPVHQASAPAAPTTEAVPSVK